MNREAIKRLVSKSETAAAEFKRARGGVPADFWPSYSAFANTDGGTIILGVREKSLKVGEKIDEVIGKTSELGEKTGKVIGNATEVIGKSVEVKEKTLEVKEKTSEVGEKTGVSDYVKTGSGHVKPISDYVNRDFEAFGKQCGRFTKTICGICHDRFIIVDGKEVFWTGASFNDAGRLTFAAAKMGAEIIRGLLNSIRWVTSDCREYGVGSASATNDAKLELLKLKG